MAAWKLTVKLSDLVEQYKRDETDIPELARLAAERLAASGWRDFTPRPDVFDDVLRELRTSLTEADYSSNFEELYDLADADRVWIETVS